MKKISFKNGDFILVTQEVANIIRDRIIDEKSNDFQCFSDQNGICNVIVRLSEIVSMS